MRGILERKVALVVQHMAREGVEPPLAQFPPIGDLIDLAEARGLEAIPRHTFTQSVQGSFYYGMLMGSLHRELSLRSLNYSVLALQEIVEEEKRKLAAFAQLSALANWPSGAKERMMEVASEIDSMASVTYEGILRNSREMVAEYERKHGMLS